MTRPAKELHSNAEFKHTMIPESTQFGYWRILTNTTKQNLSVSTANCQVHMHRHGQPLDLPRRLGVAKSTKMNHTHLNGAAHLKSENCRSMVSDQEPLVHAHISRIPNLLSTLSRMRLHRISQRCQMRETSMPHSQAAFGVWNRKNRCKARNRLR
jgi:hypothetical protein